MIAVRDAAGCDMSGRRRFLSSAVVIALTATALRIADVDRPGSRLSGRVLARW
ncbi:hypothetical protein OHA77_11100 [Streptosporangium sp. NBC_01639]|uniref:hypothetical protein n=1 Tax=unclassified Streptosporangium TaxID=2632669 RepID=UPI002DD87E1C|nr:hypothetical protein [Streptosporangium sp. NBC_01756]WSC84327.1 hypothetical protein OIE48_28605 [Streptosporangium sp. NBC_01756]WTD57047.1 hypothetical protein OHA77_11100 [Streptosporangium sp. NBC_01639]